MLVFRSEDHLETWLARGNPRGDTMSLEQQWDVAREWFAGRHLASWKKRTPEQAQEVLVNAGLTSPFWSFSGAD
jgi:hypothetical protein